MLQVGAQGSQVRKLQQQLQAAGCDPGDIDGVFGPHTLAAVRKYQTQHRLEVDGVVGPNTWKALMSDGFSAQNPHPQPSAPTHRSSGGVSNVPAPSGSHGAQVQRMLSEAESHLGFHEGPRNSNPFSHYFGRPGEAWCADFVSYCATQAGFQMNTASAQGVANKLKDRGLWKGRNDPQVGDIVTFRWDGSHGWADHVGLVENVFSENGRQFIQTIEGNSSDGVHRRTYPAFSSVINGFGQLS